MNRATHVLGLACAAALAPFVACSDDFNGASVDAGADPDGGGAPDHLVHDDQPVEPIDAAPIFNAEGWVRLDFDPNCAFYAAPSPDKMPPPIQWENCAPTVAPLGLSCQQIEVTWPPASGMNMAPSPAGWVDSAGKAWLMASRFSANSVLKFVAEADGVVHQAVGYTAGRCSLSDGSISGAHAIFSAERANASGTIEQWGALGGPVDEVPMVLESWPDGKGRAYLAGPSAYFTLGGDTAVKSWAPGGPILGAVSVADPGTIQAPVFVGPFLFFEVSNLSYSKIKRYTVSSGATDFISFGNDVSANAADFGTDGVDMVWTEGAGRASPNDPWTTISIMTAKFTTESASIQKRRLRSEKRLVGTAPYVVGCGFAAHFISSVEEGTGVRIVRLADGQSWRLTKIVDGGSYWFFQNARAITCSEIFLNVSDSGAFNVARIRLDSLGPGEAAD